MSATLHDAPPQERVDRPDDRDDTAASRRTGLLRELLLAALLRRERRDHREHRTYAPRRRPFAGLRRLVAVVAAGALLLTGIALGRGLDFLPGFGNPFEDRRTERVDPPLLLTMQDLAEFRAGSGTFQQVVEIKEGRDHLPDWLAGRKDVFLAVGTVDAIVDFGGLTGDAVVMSADRTAVTIRLPKPRLDAARVDPERSRPLDEDRGLGPRIADALGDGPESDRDLYLLAQRSIGDAAVQSDLLRRAEDQTRSTITALANSLGFTSVTVEFGPPAASR